MMESLEGWKLCVEVDTCCDAGDLLRVPDWELLGRVSGSVEPSIHMNASSHWSTTMGTWYQLNGELNQELRCYLALGHLWTCGWLLLWMFFHYNNMLRRHTICLVIDICPHHDQPCCYKENGLIVGWVEVKVEDCFLCFLDWWYLPWPTDIILGIIIVNLWYW